MALVRLGAVGFLNARPLTWVLDQSPDRWNVRYDVPSVCSTLLREGAIDVGLVPSIDYLDDESYRVVPGVAIGSRGPVASVALYTTRPLEDIQSIALDTNSRTSVALLRILCRHHFRIAPAYVHAPPDVAAMVRAHDAGLLIGDPAFDTDHEALGLTKIDLGASWTEMTGLPFVYAAWTGRAGAIGATEVRALQDAQAAGVGAIEAIAEAYGRGDPVRSGRARDYLRHNVRYGLGVDETAGLQRFLDLAADLDGLVRGRRMEYF